MRRDFFFVRFREIILPSLSVNQRDNQALRRN